jgi:hypothetical protein
MWPQLVYKRGASAEIADDIDDCEALAEGGIPRRGGRRDRARLQPAVLRRVRFGGDSERGHGRTLSELEIQLAQILPGLRKACRFPDGSRPHREQRSE